MNLQLATAEHLSLIDEIASAYRDMWSSLKNSPFPCDFSGTVTDIEVLDFIDYEALHQPGGLFEAAIIWGNVIAKNGVLHWHISEAGDYILSTSQFPNVFIWPLARITEIKYTSGPQFGKYRWLLEEAVSRCLVQGLDTEEDSKLLSLLDTAPDEGFSHYIGGAIECIRERIKDA